MSTPVPNPIQPGSKQVPSIAMSGPGAKQLENTSIMLAGMQVQQAEDSKFDPKVDSVTYSVIKQGFCSDSVPYPTALMIVGVLCIVYGIVAK
jgi:hypothetical protein